MTLPQVEALIFAEHSKLSVENPLLKEKIRSLQDLNSLYVKTDSLQRIELNMQKNINSFNEQNINKLHKKLKIFQILAIVGGCLFIGKCL